MSPTILLTLQAMIVLLAPLLLGWWIRRKFGARWSTWGWGALAFVLSQLVRMPLLIGLTVLLSNSSFQPDEGSAFWINLVILTVTAGLFEETARYIVLRWLARDAREWRDGVMFGAGHGGIEAMLIVGGAAINGLVLLSMGDTMLAQLESTAPNQVSAVANQLEILRTLTWVQPAMAIWERVLAITFHIAASLLVLQSVRGRGIGGWLWAVLLHIAFNAVALLILRYSTPLAVEAALTLFIIIPVAIIVRSRHW